MQPPVKTISIGCDAEERRHLDARILVELGRALGQAMHAAQHVGAAGRLVGPHGVEHRVGVCAEAPLSR